jgi:hypothetical protein
MSPNAKLVAKFLVSGNATSGFVDNFRAKRDRFP